MAGSDDSQTLTAGVEAVAPNCALALTGGWCVFFSRFWLWVWTVATSFGMLLYLPLPLRLWQLSDEVPGRDSPFWRVIRRFQYLGSRHEAPNALILGLFLAFAVLSMVYFFERCECMVASDYAFAASTPAAAAAEAEAEAEQLPAEMACVFDETAQVAAAAAAAQAQDEDHHQQAAEAAAAIGSSSVGAVHSIGSGGHFVIWVEATLLLSLRVLLFRGHYGLITEYTNTYVAHRREHFAEAINCGGVKCNY
eukprot:COSAG06_NODE_2554_length_6676_cov_11.776646_4_plen_251_part_00